MGQSPAQGAGPSKPKGGPGLALPWPQEKRGAAAATGVPSWPAPSPTEDSGDDVN